MNKRSLIFDVVVAIACLLAFNPSITGMTVHEWLSLAVLLVVLIHICAHAGWFARNFAELRKTPNARRIGRLALNLLTFVVFAVCAVSGLFISGSVLPAAGLFATGFYVWQPLHATSAKLLLALLLVHVGFHIRPVVSWLRHKKR